MDYLEKSHLFETALTEFYRQGVEDAARVVEQEPYNDGDLGYESQQRRIKDIRALLEEK